ncbi:hypothetical protein BDN71DRAFT_1506243 [Pleurotus eryngii]|uniref:Carbohydrate-binding module family 19 domain-containing protein n=1 Tax=Pleurotus eryngii TaxID=5323 RepID=A0A9P5ZWS3_PLEER|nr:hypothetical protein BDN71DRAFT_1506243 [Pleurotus eryngii]
MAYINFNAFFALSALASLVSAAPVYMQKRIAQSIAESTAQWEQACLKAGGAGKCNPISQTAFTSLLAAGGNCDQQNAADSMVDLAKSLNNDPEMIRLAQLFVQQPRNAPDSLQVPYCQQAPKNAELTGLFHCQFAGSNFAKFSGDQTGNLPLGVSAVNPPGSCPAKKDGPVPDGVQLNTLVNDPGVGAANAGAGAKAGGATDDVANPPDVRLAGQGQGQSAAPPPPPAAAPPATAAPAANAKSFTLANGQDAIALNAKFSSLTATSPCNDGEQACVNGQFGQCVGGKFALTGCAGGTQCFALPLVNSRGTSITCSTAADAQARIAATGAA